MNAVFVGRRAEIAMFEKWMLATDRNIALVVGPPGIGKTELLHEFERVCDRHEGGKWIVVSAVVNANETSAAFLERLLDELFKVYKGTYIGRGPQDREKLKLLLKSIPKIGEYIASFVEDQKQPAWLRFRDLVNLIGNNLDATDRLVFLVDPKHEMQAGQDNDWLALAGELPGRVRIVIAQRPDDVLAGNPEAGMKLGRIPTQGSLGELSEGEVEDLYAKEMAVGRLKALAATWPEDARRDLAKAAFARYRGYPVAHGAVVNLLFQDTPADPIAEIKAWPQEVEALMEMLFQRLARQGEDLLNAALVLAVFSVPVPPEYWAKAAGKSTAWLTAALADPKFAMFVAKDQQGYTPYHSLFTERLDRHLDDLPETRKQLVEAAWAALGIESFEVPDDAKKYPAEFALLAAVPVAIQSDQERLFATLDLLTRVKARIGMLDSLISDVELIRSRDSANDAVAAACSLNLGGVLWIRGDFDAAEGMCRKSMEIYERLGLVEGMVAAYGNLGNVLQGRGDLHGAEAVYRKALEVNERLGRLEGMASVCCNLGVLLEIRGNLDGAEAMFRRALEVNEQLGRLEGMANTFGNLGNLLWRRGDLDGAEAMYRKSLAINEGLGHLGGIANQYGGLGIVLQSRGDLAGAGAMYHKSLEINEKLGRLVGMAKDFGNLGNVLKMGGDLVGAEAMYRNSLDISEKAGSLEGMAIQHNNLGVLLANRNDLEGARRCWKTARDLYARLGAMHNVERLDGWIRSLGSGGGN